MKTIIVACGGGIATSATCATKINSALEERGLGGLAKAKAVDIKSLDNLLKLLIYMYQLLRCEVYKNTLIFQWSVEYLY